MRLLAFLPLLLLFACGEKPAHRVVSPAFFYWQTTFRLSPAEVAYLDSLACKRLYVKALDLGRDPLSGEIVPLARLEMADTAGLADRETVPCVFITNAVFENFDPAKTEWLAEKTLEAVQNALPGRYWPECQIDCDWTATTRPAYFAYLQALKKRLPADRRLSATIRLHQYKFPRQTGVPPVDRGLLMLYNTGDIDDPDAGNSIFEPADARRYLDGAPRRYPLPLDVALPVFSWALVYRDDALWKIIPGLGESDLRDTSVFLPAKSGYVVQRGTFRDGFYLRPGDRVRAEAVPPERLREAARLAAGIELANDAHVAFFHLDTATLRLYPVPTLQTIWQEFSPIK